MRGAFDSLIYGVVSRAIFFSINMLAVAMLTPSDYGAFSFFLSVVSSMVTLSAFGSGVTTNVYVAKNFLVDLDFVKRLIFSNLIIVSVLSLLFTLIFFPMFWLEDVQGVGPEQIKLVMVVMVWLLSVGGVVDGALNGVGAYRILSINSIVVFFLTIPISFFLIQITGFWGGIASVVIARVFLVLLNFLRLYAMGCLGFRYSLHNSIFDRKIRFVLFEMALPSFIAGVMFGPVIAVAMKIISASKNGLIELAFFSLVYQIFIVAVFLPGVLGGYFLSSASRRDASSNILKILMLYGFYSLFVAIVLYFLKAYILRLAGADYVNGADRIYDLMMLTIIFHALNNAFLNHVLAIHGGWPVFFINLLWAMVILVVTKMFVHEFGGSALALAFLLANIIQFIAYIITILFLKNNNRLSTQSA